MDLSGQQFPDAAGVPPAHVVAVKVEIGAAVDAGVGGCNGLISQPKLTTVGRSPVARVEEKGTPNYAGMPDTVYAYTGKGSHDEGWGLGV